MITDFASDLMLDHLFGVATFTPPAGLWVQLHAGDPGEGLDAPAAATDRQPVTFTAPVTRDSANAGAVEWPAMTATETLSHFSIWDADTGGNCWMAGYLEAPEDVTAGEPFTIAPGRLVVALGGHLTVWSANALLGMVLLGQTFTVTGRHVQLHSGPAGADATSNALPVARSTLADVAAASGGLTANTTAVEWANLPATAIITDVSVWDNPTAGNPVWHGPLIAPRAVNSGSGAAFPVSALVFGIA